MLNLSAKVVSEATDFGSLITEALMEKIDDYKGLVKIQTEMIAALESEVARLQAEVDSTAFDRQSLQGTIDYLELRLL